MFVNYLKVAFRNLSRQRLYSFINITGLAVGITACILIMLFVRYELSYDRYHEKADRIYRLGEDAALKGRSFRLAVTAAPFGPALVRDYPQVEACTRVRNFGYPVIRYGVKAFSEERWFTVDSSFFEVFTVKFLAGDPGTALVQPNTVVITESMAEKYFGDENPMGKTLNSDKRRDYIVTGVIEDSPSNTHFHYDFLASLETYLDESSSQHWFSENYYTYIVVQEGVDPQEIENVFAEVIQRYVGPQIQQLSGLSLEQFLGEDSHLRYFMQALPDIHLHSNLDIEIEPNGDIKYVTIFSIIALFILLIACINFMNLSTARSAKRAKEVGIRKTLGSNRGSLIMQFLSESILMALLAVLIAMVLVKILLPGFNNLISGQLHLSYFDNPGIVLFLIGLALAVGLLAGSYPALFLAGFQPIKVLKSDRQLKSKNSWLRSGLVIFQFTISIILFTGAIIVYNQLSYMQNKKLGFKKEQLLVVEKTDDLRQDLAAFKRILADNPAVLSVTSSTSIPGRSFSNNGHRIEGQTYGEIVPLAQFWADHNFAQTYQLEMARGRFFEDGRVSDSSAVVINEACAKVIGFDDPIGKKIFSLRRPPEEDAPYTIIGVVKNFHFQSLHKEIVPVAIKLADSRGGQRFTTLKVETDYLPATIATIEKEWKKLANGQGLEYVFLDDDYNRLYANEQQTRRIVTVFSFLAIVVACLGLFGLASFSVEQRTKEIGIRKALGATVPGIFGLLSKDILKLVILATLISFPISYFIMNSWLQNFAYRINYNYFGFVFAGLIAFLVAILTVSNQVVRAARSNPVSSLRYE